VGLLVDELGYSFPPARPEQIPASNGSLHRYFPETRHVASYAFLDYFREHGGLRIFGYPRSEFMYEGGHVVQYFQRMRMEWHPERAVGSQMLLANLGEVYIERFGVPGNYLDPVQPPSAPGESVTNASDAGDADTNPYQTVTRLSASASVREAITGRQGTQTLYVYVTDQQHNPVAGASVTMMARYPSRRQRLELEPTNDSGFTNGSFEILPAPPGRRVIIDVLVTYHSLERTTQTFFLPWW
jgi:hypothetical protein